jgi:thiosulfate/3-mercaptopyruvate sulfurtransferase
VSASWVRAHLGDTTVVFVDARPAEQYLGAEPGCPPGQTSCGEIPAERRGHLPGAKSLFWMGALVSRDDPVLKPMHFLHEELWKPTGADQPGVRTIVTYCRTGMQASHAYFVARYLGYPDVRLYDGSFIEWAALQPAASFLVERAGP